MCVVTIATVAAVAGVAAAGVGTLGAYNQAKAQANAAEYNAKVAQQNAELARRHGKLAQADQEKEARAMRSRLIAKTGASGLLSSSGSNLDTLLAQTEVDLANYNKIGYNAEIQAAGYSNQAELSQMQASAAKASATTALVGGGLNTVGAAASGYSSVQGAQAAQDSLTKGN